MAAGCANSKDPSRIEITAADLPASAGVICNSGQTEGCSWQSSDWDNDPWLFYPGKATVAIEHGLGRVPTGTWLYIAFEEEGAGAALAAGDLARISSVTATHVEIKNDTNADYFCRLVLQ